MINKRHTIRYLWWFQWNIKKLRSFIKVSKNERRTYLTNFIAVSISNGYKTKLNSNFVLALSLSYWPINHMSEVNSPTNRNLILTSTDLQLMNSIVPKPYMILMKWWLLKTWLLHNFVELNLTNIQSAGSPGTAVYYVCLLHRMWSTKLVQWASLPLNII